MQQARESVLSSGDDLFILGDADGDVSSTEDEEAGVSSAFFLSSMMDEKRDRLSSSIARGDVRRLQRRRRANDGGNDPNELSDDAFWKMEYILEKRLQKLASEAETKWKLRRDKLERRMRRDQEKREQKMHQDVALHYQSLHAELERRQKWVDERIQSLLQPNASEYESRAKIFLSLQRQVHNLSLTCTNLHKRIRTLERDLSHLRVELGNEDDMTGGASIGVSRVIPPPDTFDRKNDRTVVPERRFRRMNTRRSRHSSTPTEVRPRRLAQAMSEGITPLVSSTPVSTTRPEPPLVSSFERTMSELVKSNRRCVRALKHSRGT